MTPAIGAALAAVPRHEFVPFEQRSYTYENRPLPIGYGQFLPPLDLVALMIDCLQPQPGQAALVVGASVGYPVAVLAKLVEQVYAIETSALLAQMEQQQKKIIPPSVRIRVGRGYDGWVETAPFDVLLVVAAADHVPPPLLQQLKPGGRMVIAIGTDFSNQQLTLVEKHAEGPPELKPILPVQLMPLTSVVW